MLGEGIEKKQADLGAEVAAQTAALKEKAESAAKAEAEELPEPDMSAPSVQVSVPLAPPHDHTPCVLACAALLCAACQ